MTKGLFSDLFYLGDKVIPNMPFQILPASGWFLSTSDGVLRPVIAWKCVAGMVTGMIAHGTRPIAVEVDPSNDGVFVHESELEQGFTDHPANSIRF